MKNMLITGGAGFLGTHSVEKYLENDYKVTVIDNFSTAVINEKNSVLKNVNLINGNILDYQSFELLGKFNLILHLASPVGPAGILKHSGRMARYILDDVYWAIDCAVFNNCPLIFLSTSEIYGYRDKPILLKEEDDKILMGDFKVRNEYSVSKLLAEIVLSNISKINKNLKYQIIRPFNISGARQLKTGGFVLPTFVQQALNNEDITVFGDGTQVRAFTHVKDIVDGIFLTSQSEQMNQIWNVGNSDNITSIYNMAKLVKEKLNSKSEIKLVDPKTIHGPLYEEAWDKIPDATKIKTQLNWQPKYSIDYIINDVIEYYKK